MRSLTTLLSFFTASLLSMQVVADCEPSSVKVDWVSKVTEIGNRSHKTKDGFIIYEGSLYRNLINVAKESGLSGIKPFLKNDVFISKRLEFRNTNLNDLLAKLEEVVNGVSLRVSGDVIVIEELSAPTTSHFTLPTLSAITPQTNEQSCKSGNIFVFEVKPTTLEENIATFKKLSGWEFYWEQGSEPYKSIQMTSATLTGSSYYEILARLLASTGVGAVYE